MTTRQYKQFKGLKKENLRDNMSTAEIVLNMLAEVSTTEISKNRNPQGFEESRAATRSGGEVAGNARRDMERRTGKSVISSQNAAQLNAVVTDIIETIAENGEKREE